MNIIYPDRYCLQPIYRKSGELIFSEVLARFENGLTNQIILDAESDGSIFNIDIRSLEFGIKSIMPVAVNISQRSIEHNLVNIGRCIRPGITIEITETHKTSIDKLRSFAFEVHARGGNIAINDIGSGAFADYESIVAVIKATNPQWIKLPLSTDSKLIHICKITRIPLIFALIETRSDLLQAIDLGATGLQGWFFESASGMYWLQNQRLLRNRNAANELQLALTG